MPQNKSKDSVNKKKPANKGSVKSDAAKKRIVFASFVRKYIGWVLATIIAVTYAIALFAALNMSSVPTKFVLLIVPLSLLVVTGLVVTNIRYSWRSLLKSIALVCMSLLVLLANGYVYTLSKSTDDFFANIQSGEYRLESYSIATKSAYDVSLTNATAIGYLFEDPNIVTVLDEVQDKTDASPQSYPELASLTVALDDRAVDSIVIRSGLLPLLEQNYLSFYQSLTILETFDVKVKNDAPAKRTDITKPYAVFIGGIDTYGDIGSVSRSDVNIVAVINPQTRKVLLVNTPRDYYVQLHGTTGSRDKLTHAGIYGIDMSRQTLEDLYGVPIDYSVRINFTSLIKIIDTLDTVIVYSDNAFSSGGYTFEQGYNQLDSKQALEFSRNRKAFENGDRTRGQNQQRVIEAIIDKVNEPRSLLKYQTVIKGLSNSFETNASSEEVSAVLKQQMNTLGYWQSESMSVEGADSRNVTYSMGRQQLYVMEPNIESLNVARAKMQEYFK